MALKKNIQESISIRRSLSMNQKIELGKRIVEEVRDRTERGIDKNGKRFVPYSKDSEKKGTPNLASTGDMLIELDVINISGSSITIGYETDFSEAGQVEGNVIGSYGQSKGNSSKARDFIGLPQKVVNILTEELLNDPEFKEERVQRESIVSSILNRIGR